MIYTPENGLNSSGSGVVITNNNLRIVGGCNSEFSIIVGYSKLDGTNGLQSCVLIKNVTNVVMGSFVIRRENANGVILIIKEERYIVLFSK